jgi:hypothetical protein
MVGTLTLCPPTILIDHADTAEKMNGKYGKFDTASTIKAIAQPVTGRHTGVNNACQPVAPMERREVRKKSSAHDPTPAQFSFPRGTTCFRAKSKRILNFNV